jgi:hypothetical protein
VPKRYLKTGIQDMPRMVQNVLLFLILCQIEWRRARVRVLHWPPSPATLTTRLLRRGRESASFCSVYCVDEMAVDSLDGASLVGRLTSSLGQALAGSEICLRDGNGESLYTRSCLVPEIAGTAISAIPPFRYFGCILMPKARLNSKLAACASVDDDGRISGTFLMGRAGDCFVIPRCM